MAIVSSLGSQITETLTIARTEDERNDDLNKAQKHFQKVLEVNHENWQAHSGLAYVLHLKKDYQAAFEHYQDVSVGVIPRLFYCMFASLFFDTGNRV